MENTQEEIEVDIRVLRNLETGEEVGVFWTDAEYYERMDDDMVIHFEDQKWEWIPKDRSYFEFNRNRGAAGNICVWTKPLVSASAGCQPSQVKEFNEKAKADGFTGVSFRKDGDAQFTTRGQRASYLAHIGMCDRSGTYGDHKERRR